MYKDSRFNRIEKTGFKALEVLTDYRNGKKESEFASLQLLAEIAVNTAIIIDMLEIVFTEDSSEDPYNNIDF